MHFFDFISLVSPKLVLVSIKKFVKNTLLRIIFSRLFSVFGNTVMFLMYYLVKKHILSTYCKMNSRWFLRKLWELSEEYITMKKS